MENLCAECGAPLAANLPEGLCSRCALSGALELRSDQSAVAAPLASAADLSPAPGSEKSAVLSRDAAKIAGGHRSFGDYELLEEIARGGMGIVYKARQISLDRIVAVKLLLLGQYASQEFIHRFRIEASAAASLQHPNIVAIHEVGVHQGQHYFAMDFVDGPNLAQFIGNKPLPAKGAACYVKTVAEAIQFAHTRRILHRDLKPSNVLIDSNDQPRVTDFGLAKRLTPDSSVANEHSSLTVTGQVLGSPNFMPPEQASGRRGQMGPPSDVYSLGAILYHALTGRPPFVGEALSDTLHQVLNTERVAPRLLVPSIPADLETICLKCLEKDRPNAFNPLRS
jgi:serine/threonine protein kinase